MEDDHFGYPGVLHVHAGPREEPNEETAGILCPFSVMGTGITVNRRR